MAWPLLILSTLLTVGLVVDLALINTPSVNTDLADFAPDSESADAHERISEYFGNETRPMFVHVTNDNGGNVLEMSSIHLMNEHLQLVQDKSDEMGGLVVNWITAPSILQVALDEQANGTELSSIENWEYMLNSTIEDIEDTDCPGDISKQREVAQFILDGMLNKDFDGDEICAWIQSNGENGSPEVNSSSTLWILEIDPNISSKDRKEKQNELRTLFSQLSKDSELNYGVASLDLISHDIDEGTFDNLATLIFLAVLVVVVLLAIAFRSFKGVVFPLVGLSFALIWTYGLLNLTGARFTALEVAVAPLVLGLGIDYSIHLQRRHVKFRNKIDDAAESWLASCARLSTPLGLAVITTVAAFLANIVSPLPPLETFGIALAVGVLSAFFNATIVVGALHIVLDSRLPERRAEPILMPLLSAKVVSIQKSQQVTILLIALLLTGASVIGALGLETEFDLADFLDEDMPIMEVREQLDYSYESAGWKLIYVHMEPASGDAIDNDETLLYNLRIIHCALANNHDVVGGGGVSCDSSPSYEGPYNVLFDAVENNESFGVKYGLSTNSGKLKLLNSSNIDLGAALSNLNTNYSIADPFTGETWADRVSSTVHLDGSEIKHIRIEIRVDASTSSESSRVVSWFEEMLGQEDDSGKIRYSLSGIAIVHVTGDLVALQTVLDGLNSSQLSSTAISFGVSFIVLLILTRKITPTMVVLTPVVLATIWVVGSMVVLSLKWNVLTVMVTALSLGIGIDYAIHMWRRFESERKHYDNIWDALTETISTTGIALVLSAGTTVLGFLVLLLSPMPLVQQFGLVTALTVTFSLLLSVLVLPVLLIMSENQSRST
ncbi:MAG: MMPL family transporter [Candidatus Poseidoniaceae archaeon]|jgi:predicted RND superfamily exporter protein|nr:MMPL family transporter [Candidatus Poseidoniaceae archaeon]